MDLPPDNKWSKDMFAESSSAETIEQREPQLELEGAGAASAIGCEREVNEDRCHAFAVDGGKGCVVCDGMGGELGGATAAQFAVSAFVASLKNSSERDAAVRMREAIVAANKEIIHYRSNPDCEYMGTTMVSALQLGAQVIIAHVGDSRAYCVHGNEATQITVDHTYVQEWLIDGKITPEQALTHPQGHILSRCLGVMPEVEPSVDCYAVGEPAAGNAEDIIVLTSDGLHRMISLEEMAEVVRSMSPQEAALYMVELAKSRGGHDDMTVAVLPLSGALYPARTEETRKVEPSVIEEMHDEPAVTVEIPASHEEEVAPLVMTKPVRARKQTSKPSRRAIKITLMLATSALIAGTLARVDFKQAFQKETPRQLPVKKATLAPEIETAKVLPALSFVERVEPLKLDEWSLIEVEAMTERLSLSELPRFMTEFDSSIIEIPAEEPMHDAAETDATPPAAIEHEMEATVTSTPAEAEAAIPEPVEDPRAQLERLFQDGLEMAKQKRVPEAIAIFEEIIKTEPNYIDALYNLGTLYASERKLDNATVSFRSVLRLKPDHAEAKYNLALVLYLKGQHDVALATFQQFLTLANGKPELKAWVAKADNAVKAIQKKQARGKAR